MCKCGKYPLVFVNALFMISSIVLLVAGILMIANVDVEVVHVDYDYRTTGYVLIGTAVLMFFLSILGFYGALVEDRCLLITYVILLFPIMLALLAGSIIIGLTMAHVDTKGLVKVEGSDPEEVKRAFLFLLLSATIPLFVVMVCIVFAISMLCSDNMGKV